MRFLWKYFVFRRMFKHAVLSSLLSLFHILFDPSAKHQWRFFYIYKFKSSQTHKKIKKRWISHIAMKRLVVRCERGIFFICIKILDFDIFNISAANSRLALSAFFIFIIFFYRALSYVSEQSRALEIAIGHSRIFYKIQKILKTHKIVAHYSKK